MCKSLTHSRFRSPPCYNPSRTTLFHYSEKFSRDTDCRQDLVLLAWQQDLKLAERSSIQLLKHYMKLRSKEIQNRSVFGVAAGGKSKFDVWHYDRLSINKRLADGSAFPLADTLSSVGYDPLGTCIVNEFEDSLLEREADVAEQMVSGYKDIEGCKTLHLPMSAYRLLKGQVQVKAMEYLV